MAKSKLTLRLPAKLLAQFIQAALKADRRPSDVIEDFMRSYVSAAQYPMLTKDSALPVLAEICQGKIIDYALALQVRRSQKSIKEGEKLASMFFESRGDFIDRI